MKKILSILSIFLFFSVSLFVGSNSKAEEDLSFGWVCCKDLSTGCADMTGLYWPEDYKRYAPTCTIGGGTTN